jgi:hypothetical protein
MGLTKRPNVVSLANWVLTFPFALIRLASRQTENASAYVIVRCAGNLSVSVTNGDMEVVIVNDYAASEELRDEITE